MLVVHIPFCFNLCPQLLLLVEKNNPVLLLCSTFFLHCFAFYGTNILEAIQIFLYSQMLHFRASKLKSSSWQYCQLIINVSHAKTQRSESLVPSQPLYWTIWNFWTSETKNVEMFVEWPFSYPPITERCLLGDSLRNSNFANRGNANNVTGKLRRSRIWSEDSNTKFNETGTFQQTTATSLSVNHFLVSIGKDTIILSCS